MPAIGAGKNCQLSKKTSWGNTFSLNEVKHQNTGFFLLTGRFTCFLKKVHIDLYTAD